MATELKKHFYFMTWSIRLSIAIIFWNSQIIMRSRYGGAGYDTALQTYLAGEELTSQTEQKQLFSELLLACLSALTSLASFQAENNTIVMRR